MKGILTSMWISIYNRDGVGDVIMFSKGTLTRDRIATSTVGDVTRIFNNETKETMGYNIQNISKMIQIEGKGRVHLSQTQLDLINQSLYEQGFDTIPFNDNPRLVVAEVLEVKDLEGSDHLHITQTKISPDEVVQIVCGAPNVREGMFVVAALPGAVMPNGQVIWEGELRGVSSYGMLTSAFELGVDPEHVRKGILEIKNDVPVGTSFDKINSEHFVEA